MGLLMSLKRYVVWSLRILIIAVAVFLAILAVRAWRLRSQIWFASVAGQIHLERPTAAAIDVTKSGEQRFFVTEKVGTLVCFLKDSSEKKTVLDLKDRVYSDG